MVHRKKLNRNERMALITMVRSNMDADSIAALTGVQQYTVHTYRSIVKSIDKNNVEELQRLAEQYVDHSGYGRTFPVIAEAIGFDYSQYVSGVMEKRKNEALKEIPAVIETEPQDDLVTAQLCISQDYSTILNSIIDILKYCCKTISNTAAESTQKMDAFSKMQNINCDCLQAILEEQLKVEKEILQILKGNEKNV